MADNIKQKKVIQATKDKPMCKYGLSCYQKNPEHHSSYRHPSPDPSAVKVVTDEEKDLSPKKKVLADAEQPVVKTLTVKNSDKQSKRSPSPRRRKAAGGRLSSPSADSENIKEKFLVDMPEDFFELWQFCESLHEDPSEAFAELDLHLVGPYDILAKKIGNKDIVDDNILRHWRYFYDPPEFQTVIKRDGDDCYHIGYFRDHSTDMPFGLASNCASVGPKFKLMGDNIFAALNLEISNALKKSSSKSTKEKFENILKKLQAAAKSKKYSLDEQTAKTKSRQKAVVAKTFHGFGMVVPYNKAKDIGYRPLPDSDAKLRSILTKIVNCQVESERLRIRQPLDDIITNVQFANDECDFGMGLELGLDMFCFGEECLHGDILAVLPLAYDLVQRPEYGKIIEVHLKNRRKGDKLSIKDQ